MIKKYTAWLHDTHELVDSERDDIAVLVLYKDHIAVVDELHRLLDLATAAALTANPPEDGDSQSDAAALPSQPPTDSQIAVPQKGLEHE